VTRNNTNNAEPTATSTPAPKPKPKHEITWGGFCALNPPKAVKANVFRTVDTEEGHFSKASIRFLQKHGIARVYAPGTFPL
jgi:hypothetical protein